MKVATLEHIDSPHILSPNSRANTEQRYLYNAGKLLSPTELAQCLNSIQNQGIASVDLKTLTYTVGSSILPLDAMATAEKVFLWAYIADACRIPIWIYKYDTQLSARTAKLFINQFKHSPYVNVAVETDLSFFKILWEELCCN